MTIRRIVHRLAFRGWRLIRHALFVLKHAVVLGFRGVRAISVLITRTISQIISTLFRPIFFFIQTFFSFLYSFLILFSAVWSTVCQHIYERHRLIRKSVDWLARKTVVVREKIQIVVEMMSAFYRTSKEGVLSWDVICSMALKNLFFARSRTTVTVGALAFGTLAIVMLVGFVYGLQFIVTDRLIQPNSLRLADVQSSSTALELNQKQVQSIREIEGVEAVVPVLSLAGAMQFGESRTEVVVMGARNTYLDFTNTQFEAGGMFSQEADEEYLGVGDDFSTLLDLTEQGDVAGVRIDGKVEFAGPITGQSVSYRIDDGVYIPLRSSPKEKGAIVGYVRGSVVESHPGMEVWGGPYDNGGIEGKAFYSTDGTWNGKWIQTEELLVYQKQEGLIYVPETDNAGNRVKKMGYLPYDHVYTLTKDEESLNNLYRSVTRMENRVSGAVLGDATGSAEVSGANATGVVNAESASEASAEAVEDAEASQVVILDQSAQNSTAAASLQEFLSQTAGEKPTSLVSHMRVEITRDTGKEILISSALARFLELSPAEVIGKTTTMDFILGGNLISNISSRIQTEPETYTIVGVFNDDKNLLVYVPLAEFESLGLAKYSLIKVLATDPEQLVFVRDQIQSLGFITRSISDTLLQVDRLFRVMRFLLGSFGMIAFIVAVFGMFNTLTVSLLERTREIGVMKTLGMSDSDITRLLLVESSCIGFTGGVLGIVSGVVLGTFADYLFVLFRNTSVHLFQFPPVFLIGVLVLSTVVGLVTGFYPAYRSRMIEPLNALRYE